VQNITTVLGTVWCHVPRDLINTAALPECRRADTKLNGIFPTLQYSIKLCLQHYAKNILSTTGVLFICRYSSRLRRSSSRKRDPFTRKNRALVQVQTRHLGSRPSTRHKDRQFHIFLSQCILFAKNYSGPSRVEHNPFQDAVRLSICPTFEFNFPIRNNGNWINPFTISKIYSI